MRRCQLVSLSLLAMLAAACSKKSAPDEASDAAAADADQGAADAGGADAAADPTPDAAVPDAGSAAPDAGPAVDPLAMVFEGWSDGMALNRSALPLRFTTPAGTGAQVLLDGEVVESIAPLGCSTPATVEASLDLSGVAEAEHVLTVRANGLESSARFVLDRSAPAAERNPIDDRARGRRVACFEPAAASGDALLEGELVLGRLSDGIAPEAERLVVAAGAARALYPPSSLTCTTDSGTGYKHCSGAKATAAFGQSVDLQQVGERRWRIRLTGGALPSGTSLLGLRLGDDELLLSWPDLAIAADPRAPADDARRVSAVIGPGGGSLALTDASGVKIRLDVPMDALPKPVEIAMVPLQSPRPMDPSAGFHPGVRFEPEGLRFALYARLTLELPTGVALPSSAVVVWRTSPLTALPLPGARVLNGAPVGPATDRPNRRMVALVAHFSEMQGEQFEPSEVDFADWANEVIDESGTGALPLWALENMMELEQLREQLGTCNDPTCPELANLTAAVRQSTQTTADAACAEGTAHPTIASVDRLMRSEALAEAVGETLTGTHDCMSSILVSLCNVAGAAAAAADPLPPVTDLQDPLLNRMLDSDANLGTVYDYGQQLGLTDVTTTCTNQAVAAAKERAGRLDSTGTARGGTLYDRQRMDDLYDLGSNLANDDLKSTALYGLSHLAWANLEGTRATCAQSKADGLAALNELKDWVNGTAPLEFQQLNAGLLSEIGVRIDQCGKAFLVRSADMSTACIMGGTRDQDTSELNIHDFPHTSACGAHYNMGNGILYDIDVSTTARTIGANQFQFGLSASSSWPAEKYGGGRFGASGTVILNALKDGTLRLELDTGGITAGTSCANVDYATYGCSTASVCGCLSTWVRAGGPRDWTQPEQLCTAIEPPTYGSSPCQSGTSSGPATFPVKMNDSVGINWDFGSNQPGTTVNAPSLVTVTLE